MSNRSIYRKIARKHKVSVREVKQDMQDAINHAYQNTAPHNTVTQAYQNRVPRKGEIPTVDEFIRYASATVKAKI